MSQKQMCSFKAVRILTSFLLSLGLRLKSLRMWLWICLGV